MASRAVAGKYQLAGIHRVAARLEVLSLAIERHFRLEQPNGHDVQRLRDAGRQLQVFCGCWKRISHYQSRRTAADLDILLCHGSGWSLDLGVTPWTCQQRDLRFRWTAKAVTRLAYLADCWDAYSHREFTWNDRFIGLSDFPLHPDYVQPCP
jgi:hypothetical protein